MTVDIAEQTAIRVMGYERPPYLGAGRSWRPQQDMNQAMQVLREARHRIIERTACHWVYFQLSANIDGWAAELWWHGNPTPNYFAIRESDLAPLAICRVCLAAIED